MKLLEKFASVEIKADNRISEADRGYCLRQQKAFDESGAALLELADQMDSIYSRIAEDDRMYLDDRCNADKVRAALRSRNNTFITRVVNYFAQTYSVQLDSRVICDHLIPEKPSSKRMENLIYSYAHMSDEEKEEYHRLCKDNKRLVEEWEQSLCRLPLRYEQIVDEIFVQLGGFSFVERAMNELLEKCWRAAHQQWDGKEVFEIKNNILRITDYGCHFDPGWSTPRWELNDKTKGILDGIAHYETGEMLPFYKVFSDLGGYRLEQNQFEYTGMKIVSVKLFKNGRVDIKFQSAADVQEFVENYLRKDVGGNAA